MINAIDFTEYAGTYYVEHKTSKGIKTYEKVSGDSPMKVAKEFLKNPIKTTKNKSCLYVVSNKWRFTDKEVRENYYAEG